MVRGPWICDRSRPTLLRMEPYEELLAAQGGIARRKDLLGSGLGRNGLHRLVEQGRLRPLTPHLFTDVARPAPDEPLRAASVGLGAVVSHTSAALLWGLELVTTPAAPTVTVARCRSRTAREGVRVSRSDLLARERVDRDGLQVTTVVRTLLDLCRSLPLHEAVAAVDSALRQGLVTLDELQRALAGLPAARGRSAVARALVLAYPRCGSVLESLVRVLLAERGMRPTATQLLVRTRSGQRIGRVDFAWPELRLVVEADGFAFHSDRRAYREDRRRGNALVRAGWRVLRFSWEDVQRYPDYVAEAVGDVLRAAA